MPGFIIHMAVGQEYLRKHNMEYSEEFIKGTIAPDLVSDKSLTHYGKSPAYTNLGKYLEENKLSTLYDKGFFLHLVTDYLFYNHYLDIIDKATLHNDYDCTNSEIERKYNVKILDEVKDYAFHKDEKPKILTLELIYKVIDEISEYNLEDIEKEVKNKVEKWFIYKKLI